MEELSIGLDKNISVSLRDQVELMKYRCGYIDNRSIQMLLKFNEESLTLLHRVVFS